MQHYEFEIDTNTNGISKEVSKLEAVFSKELTVDLAHTYITSLVEKIGGMTQNPAEFIEKGKALHYTVGKEIYGPLVAGYCQWLSQECQKLGYSGDVFFALRDAAPLETAALISWPHKGLNPVGIYANRPLLGVDDEIAPETSMANGNVLAYFEKKGVHAADKVIWADTGAWGTVIKVLKTTFLKDKELYPFFWYSHNPYIPGYVNTLLSMAGLDDKFGEILNDSMECMFPQKYLRPLQIIEDSTGVVLIPSNYLAILWGQAALEGAKAGAVGWQGGISQNEQINELYKLYALSEESKQTGHWTGVLPTNTPTWSQGKEFLTQFSPGLIGKGGLYVPNT